MASIIPIFDDGPVYGPTQSSAEIAPAPGNAFGLDVVMIDGYPVDAAVSEKHDYQSDVTEYPVERGADITDHVRPKPVKVTLECFVSDVPIGTIAQDPSRKSGTPVSDVLGHLDRLRDNPEPVTVATSLRSYTDMILESVSIPRNTESGVHFTAVFVKVLLTQNIRVAVALAAAAQSKRVAPVKISDDAEAIPVYILTKAAWRDVVQAQRRENPNSDLAFINLHQPIPDPPNVIGQDATNYYLEAGPGTPPATGFWLYAWDASVYNSIAANAGIGTPQNPHYKIGYNPYDATPKTFVPTGPTLGGPVVTPEPISNFVNAGGTPVTQDPGGTNFDVLGGMLARGS